MLIPNMLLLLIEDQLIRSKFSKYVCKMSMKNSQHRPISSGQPVQAEYLTLFSRSICPEKIKMCYFVFLKILINKYSKLLNFSLGPKW